jgi:CRISPR-associated endonuclease Csn1
MVRVDVFAKTNKRGKREFYLVPIYPHHVADRKAWPAPPIKAAVAHTPESEWKQIDESYDFLFSLYPNSLIEVISAKGEIISGYFKGFDIAGGNIGIGSVKNPRLSVGRPGAKTLLSFEKLSVDRLGNVSKIKREVRTWHGEVCT